MWIRLGVTAEMHSGVTWREWKTVMAFFASKVIQATNDPLTGLLRLTLPLSVDRGKSTIVEIPCRNQGRRPQRDVAG